MLIQLTSSEVNRIVVVLEIISYFLVTLDLYGKERLLRTEERLEKIFERIRKEELIAKSLEIIASPIVGIFQLAGRFIFQGTRQSGCIGELGGCVGYLALLIGIAIAYDMFPFLEELGIVGLFLAIFFSMLIASLGLAIVILSISVLFFLIYLSLQGILIISHTLLIRWHLSGVLLLVGTLLFLIGKTLSLIYL